MVQFANVQVLFFFTFYLSLNLIRANSPDVGENTSAHSSSDDDIDSVTHIHKRIRGNTGRTIIVPLPKGNQVLKHHEGKNPIKYNTIEQNIGRGFNQLMKSNKNLSEKEAIQMLLEKMENKSKKHAKYKKEWLAKNRQKNPINDLRKTNGPRSYQNEKARSIAFKLKTKNNNIHEYKQAEQEFETKREAKLKKDRERKAFKRKLEREARMNKSI